MISSGNRSLTINEFKTMKKIYSFMVAAVAMIAAVSCNKENLNDNHLGGEVVTFRASLDGAGTKAQLVGGKSQWQAKDAITVLNGNKDYKFSTNAEGASVNFTYNNENNDFTGDKFVAVYPAQAGYPYSTDLGSMTVNAHIPTWQEAVVDSYHKDAALSVAYTETDELKFMNAVALLKFTVAEQNVKNVTFFANDESAVSGNVKIVMNNDGSEIESVEGLQTTNFGFEPDSDKVYLVPGGWTSDNARFAAYFFVDDKTNTWVDMTDNDKDGIYEAAKPSGYSNVIFCRMNPAKPDNNWNNKWNQTVNLSLSSGQVFTFKTWEDPNNENKSNGEWEANKPSLKTFVELRAKDNGALVVGKTYYMAVVPKEYAAGFSVQLKIGDAEKKTVATKETEYEIKPSSILDLGELKSPKSRDLKYSSTSVEYVLGSTFNAPTLGGTTDGGITYKSSDTSVATVDAAGNVTPLAVGTTTITASAPLKNGYAAEIASYTLKVVIKKERNLKFSTSMASSIYGKGLTEPTLSGVISGVTYSSSDHSVATVDASTGNVTVKGAGVVEITASADETEEFLAGKVSYTLYVNMLYLKPNSNWTQANARFAAYFFDNSKNINQWVDMKKLSDGTYEVKVPTTTYPNVIFCRMNPSASANNWNNKWNQTGDLKVPDDGKNLFVVTNGWWDSMGDSCWTTK